MVRTSLAVALCLLSPFRDDAFTVPKLFKPFPASLSTKIAFHRSVLFMAPEDDGESNKEEQPTVDAKRPAIPAPPETPLPPQGGPEVMEAKARATIPAPPGTPPPPQEDPEVMEAKARAQAQLKEIAEQKQTPARKMTPEEEKDIVAAALGGGVLGVILGELAVIQLPDLEMTLGPVVAPIIGALLLSGVGYAGGSLDSSIGVVIRSALGKTTRAVGKSILNGVEGATKGVVTAGQNALEKTKNEIKAIPGKVGDSATRNFEETTAKIKAVPGKVSEAAKKKASDIGEEIKATPKRVADSTKRAVETTVDNTKKAIEGAVDDAIDAVEDAVDEVVALPTKAVASVEKSVNSVLGKSPKPVPPKLPPPMDSVSRTPLKPKAPEPPGSEPESLIPRIEMLRIPTIEMPKIEVPKFETPKLAAPVKDRAVERREEQERLRQAEEQLLKSRAAAEDRKAAAKKKKEAAEAKVQKEADKDISQEVAALARRLNDEKIRQQNEERMAGLEAKRKQEEVKKRAQAAEKSLDSATPRATVSLGSLFNFGSNDSSETTQLPPAKLSSAPRGVPTISNWRQNNDGSITGKISGSRGFDDGDAVTTSSVPKGATSGMLVQTQSGSKYFLEEKAAGLSFGISLPTFGSPSPSPDSQSALPAAEAGREQAEARKTAAAEQAAAAERKREEIAEQKAALAEQRRQEAEERNAAATVAARKKRTEDEKRKSAAATTAEQKQKEAEAKRVAAAEERNAAAAVAAKKKRIEDEKMKSAAGQRQKEAEEKRAAAAAAADQRKKEAEENRAAAAEKKRNEAEEKRAAAAAARQQQQEAAKRQAVAAAKQKNVPVTRASMTPSTPKIAAPPRGVPIIKSWQKRRDGGVSGRIYNSKNFDEGEFVETSPITKGSLSDGSLVQTSSGSRYFLSPEAAVKQANIFAAIKDMSAARPGSTITLTRQRKEIETKRAMDSVKNAKPGATFSLFGLAFGDTDEGLPPAEKRKPLSTPVRTAPRGVPTITRFRQNGDGSIIGIISGSPNFTDGDRVTTSAITRGKVEKYEIVVTGSGSRYFLS